MNRQNFLGHLALALMLIVVAVFVGQLRRWDSKKQESVTPRPVVVTVEREHETDEPAELGEPEVLVRFREGVSDERIGEITARLRDRVEDEIEAVGGLVSIDSADDEEAAQVVADYSRLPEVEYVEANEQITLDPLGEEAVEGRTVSALPGGPNDPLLAEQWALINTGQREGKDRADISALDAWAKTHGSEKVVVAVLDSGVDYTHRDLSNNMWVRPDSLDPYFDEQLGAVDDEHGFSAIGNEARDPMDDNGHGTHCAGIIGAEGDNNEGIAGVNWKVEIMPLKFMSAGGFGTTKDAIEAINYVIARKEAGVNVRVISASWGSRQKSRALGDVIRKAGEEGILFVAASGNNSQNADRFPHYPSGYDLPNVLSVAALNRRDELASFSNYGPKSVHLAAPGAEILSTWLKGEYEEHSGTSMATPVVAGVAALVLSVEPNLSVAELKQRLLDSVDKLDALQGKTVSGGRVNAARAVGAAR
ncbi:MAG: S8 family serine peptidase [Acidobacteria bacterium]|nr:S8 family serine peptidase [Acidobacteriota bacterium]